MSMGEQDKASALYEEVWALSRSIVEARNQIRALRPARLKTRDLNPAFQEMEEVVKTTEDASNAIMDAAEKINSADPDAEDFANLLRDNCSLIFEACAFQDLTSQRITKVIKTLKLVDEHLDELQVLLGPEFGEEDDDDEVTSGDEALLNGPAMEGEGISQEDIDKLFD